MSDSATCNNNMTFVSNAQENEFYEFCLTREIALPANRPEIDFGSLMVLAENHLFCSR